MDAVSDLIERHLRYISAAGYAPRTTIYQRGRVLRRLDAWLRGRGVDGGVETVLPDELVEWLAALRHRSHHRSLSAATLSSYRGHLKAFYAWANARHLDYDPAADLPPVRRPRCVPRPCSTEELELALTHLPPPWCWYVLLAACAGLRCGEIAALLREDVTATRLIVRKKGGGTRLVKTHELVWRLLEPLPPGPVAAHLAGRPVTAHYISAGAARALDQLGLPTVTMHRFRHWFGSDINRRLNTRVAQDALGHASIESTAIYTDVDDADRSAAVDGLPVPHVGRSASS